MLPGRGTRCDELSGFIHACGLVRPDGIGNVRAEVVAQEAQQRAFAAGVNRDEVYKGAAELGVDERVAVIVAALRPIASELGLRTAEKAPSGGREAGVSG